MTAVGEVYNTLARLRKSLENVELKGDNKMGMNFDKIADLQRNNKSTIYICGGTMGVRDKVLNLAKHLKTNQVVKNFNVLYDSRFDTSDTIGNRHGDIAIYKKAMQSINESYVVIAIPNNNNYFDSFASFELAYADSNNIPVITLGKSENNQIEASVARNVQETEKLIGEKPNFKIDFETLYNGERYPYNVYLTQLQEALSDVFDRDIERSLKTILETVESKKSLFSCEDFRNVLFYIEGIIKEFSSLDRIFC